MNIKASRKIFLLFAVFFILGVPFIFGDYLVFVISIICAYIIVAFGMNILSGYTGLISLGHQAFFGIGAYTAAILGNHFQGFPCIVALFLGGFLSGVIGFFLGFAALRTSGVYLAIATIAFGMITGEIFNEWSSLTGGSTGLVVLPPALGPLKFESSTALYYLILGVTAVMFYFAVNLIASNTGRAFIAIRESEISAQSYGISLVKTKTVSFAVSAFYVGVAGGLYAYLIKYVAPIDFTILVGLEFVVIIVVGGLATISGSIIGAIILFSLPQLFAGLAGWQEFVTGGVLLIVILFLPDGLSGGIRRFAGWFLDLINSRGSGRNKLR
ncbi:MAG: branched-chain amino acid ABC transporter permease [Desulfatiglandaceae bacterium]